MRGTIPPLPPKRLHGVVFSKKINKFYTGNGNTDDYELNGSKNSWNLISFYFCMNLILICYSRFSNILTLQYFITILVILPHICFGLPTAIFRSPILSLSSIIIFLFSFSYSPPPSDSFPPCPSFPPRNSTFIPPLLSVIPLLILALLILTLLFLTVIVLFLL